MVDDVLLPNPHFAGRTGNPALERLGIRNAVYFVLGPQFPFSENLRAVLTGVLSGRRGVRR